MSVILYREGEQVLVPPLTLDAHLGNGYFLTREESLCEEVEDAVIEVELSEEAQLPESEISEEDIRLIAKELGISHWHVINIDKLKVKIEEKQSGDSD